MTYFISIFIIIFDQWIKNLISDNLYYGQSIKILKNLFHLTYVKNTGAAFGIFRQHTNIFIIIALLIIIIFLILNHYLSENRWFSISSGLVIGGAVGNLIDRIRLGYVVDYIDLQFWPVFNLADSAVVIGMGLLIIFIWKFDQIRTG